MVRLTIALRAASPRDARDLLETLSYLMVSTRLEPGCLSCAAGLEGDRTVGYEERWETEAHLRWRILAPSFTSLLAVLECPVERPDVRFDFGGWTRGLDFVTEVRREGLGEEG
jgi:hypothetical protein